MRKTSHCGSKRQQRSPDKITLLLLVRAPYVWVLFFTHIPFVVNRTFTATPTETLQQYKWLSRLVFMDHKFPDEQQEKNKTKSNPLPVIITLRDVTHKKTPIQNFQIFLIETTRLAASLEGLNSSLSQLDGELCWCKVLQKRGARAS